jgi:hypothetical protein
MSDSRGLNRRMFLTGMAGITGAALLGKGQEAMAQAALAADAKLAATTPAAVGADRTHIGNLQALMPGGIAFVRNDEFGIVLDVGWDAANRPGRAAPDDSINRIVFKKHAATIRFDWGRKAGSDSVVIRLVADVDTTATLQIPARPWHAFSNIIKVPDDRTVDVICLGFRRSQLPWKLISDTPLGRVGEALAMAATASFTVKLARGKAACLCAGFGELAAVESVEAALDAAAAYDKGRARKGSGGISWRRLPTISTTVGCTATPARRWCTVSVGNGGSSGAIRITWRKWRIPWACGRTRRACGRISGV